MTRIASVALPDDVAKLLEDFARAEQLSLDDIVFRAVRAYIFRKKLRRLRERMTLEAQRRNIVTDEDVFDRIS